LKVLTAENGKDAINILHATPKIDAMLVDIMMPEMDGYETMAEIRKHPKFEALPIIALTAKAMKGDREKCMKAGATDYLSKPINIEHLVSKLHEYLCVEVAAA